MYNLFSLAFALCSLYTSSNLPTKSNWGVINPEAKNKLVKEAKWDKENALLPFIWEGVPNKILDSMIEKGKIYDSIMDKRSKGQTEEWPDIVLYTLPDSMKLMYANKRKITLDSCIFTYYEFQVYPKVHYADENIYAIYFMKGFGVFGAIHKNVEMDYEEWSRYYLIDLFTKDKKSIVKKDLLKKLVEKVIFNW
ncbi:MAG: hypothetical protein P0Y49_14255 [Candidatus Pedobacter colombiensis]|uniref:Uncharacterized protein n=1 Tax=Candidatus Pedobacter colombiensis TaxID=3121371 RepID=A0AAJ5W5I2_9SPHI|nr:hypothetical protein [Pedobacter sp.]WEK17960.1 MAG: hypothetical protein P0Y49_14255 [Pedobacter sp.]